MKQTNYILMLITVCMFFSSCCHFCACKNKKREVTFVSLLEEMTDLKNLAEIPDPNYKCRQFSSYDRKSTDPNDTSLTNWFANADIGHHLRTETRNGTNEYVMMDAEGPGAIVRIWSANADGILKIYLDGATEPTIDIPMKEMMNGEHSIFISPISGIRGMGWNTYFPIPYAKRCKVTSTLQPMYYHVNYRTYVPGTKVKTFSLPDAENNIDVIRKAAVKLSEPEKVTALPEKYSKNIKEANLKTNEFLEIELKGQKALYNFLCKVNAENLEDALRGCLLEISFDGQNPSVQAPLGDFFGTAPGLNPYKSIPLGVLDDGTMYCHWVMPFKEKAKLRITNYSSVPVRLLCETVSGNYLWNGRSQYFNAKWRTLNNHPTVPRIDWTLLNCEGKGTYLGNMYQVSNPVPNWWGEGDEKIYLDGESFPSTFGTGTEDYYGYAWCWFGTFTHAFHNQVRADGPGNFGHSCVSRFHFLDAIPFDKSIKFDMEVWHHSSTTVSLASTVYWYAAPGSTDDFEPVKKEELVIPAIPKRIKIPGAIEGEEMKVVSVSRGGMTTRQIGAEFNKLELSKKLKVIFPCLLTGWHGMLRSGTRALWWYEALPGDSAELEFQSESAGTFEVLLASARGNIFGNFNISINGVPAKETLRFRAKDIALTGEINLGKFNINKGRNTLKIVATKENDNINFFCLDYIKLKTVESIPTPAHNIQ